ncbi:MAG: 4-alpha-glucanotransferase, partial [Prevotella sp.]|nr:4-alpha-glucanotransferase [Prevotella sp.]
MSALDGTHWSYQLTKTAKPGTYIDYYYSVYRGDDETRHEWLVEPHRVEFAAQKGTCYTIFDHWIDIPEDAYLYSSAFTDCIMACQRELSMPTEFERTVRLKVRAPQLRIGQQLAIVGACDALGNWDANKAIPMFEHEYHEWVVSLDASTLPQTFEFKFVMLGVDQPLWEEGPNRTISLINIEAYEVVIYELSQSNFSVFSWKGAGMVIPIFSLRSKGSFGVGDFGDLKMMVDWANKTNMRVIQVLPINDTNMTGTWQDSYPYNSISIYALHPQYTD